MSSFRLSIWQPFRPIRSLIYSSENDDDNGITLNEHNLLEEIYTWKPDMDILSGVADEDTRVSLHDRFFAGFSRYLPPQERGFDRLKNVLAFLKETLANPDSLRWTNSDQSVAGDDSKSLRCIPLIALHLHLMWLNEVYGDKPGLSITTE